MGGLSIRNVAHYCMERDFLKSREVAYKGHAKPSSVCEQSAVYGREYDEERES